MSNGTKSLSYISAIVVLIAIIFGAGGTFFVTLNIAKNAEARSAVNETRVTALENRAARFEGIMEERTRTIERDVKVINQNIIKLLETLELSDAK